jgi:hypothetical protein
MRLFFAEYIKVNQYFVFFASNISKNVSIFLKMGFPILLELSNYFLVEWNICFHDNSKRYRKFISEFILKLTKEYFCKVILRWILQILRQCKTIPLSSCRSKNMLTEKCMKTVNIYYFSYIFSTASVV